MKDPLIRRFISGTAFAGLFIWVAVYYFDVETEVVKVFFYFSILFVLGLMLVGLVLAPLVRLFRREPTFLSKIDEDPEFTQRPGDE